MSQVVTRHMVADTLEVFRGKADTYSNLTIKKIPKTVLTRCEWGHDDYSLKIEKLPQAPPEPGQQGLDFVERDSRR